MGAEMMKTQLEIGVYLCTLASDPFHCMQIETAVELGKLISISFYPFCAVGSSDSFELCFIIWGTATYACQPDRMQPRDKRSHRIRKSTNCHHSHLLPH